jgi:hypothetical protein
MEYIAATPRNVQDRAGKIRTATGKYVNPLKLRAADIAIKDVAHHLAHLCRYTGACPHFYSVAQHSVLVSKYLREAGASVELQMAGLLHDAGEAYFNDLASPVKHDPRMAWYRDAEHEATRLIFCVVGINPDLLAATKQADDAVFHNEAVTWWHNARLITPLEPLNARHQFMFTYTLLKDALDAYHPAPRF